MNTRTLSRIEQETIVRQIAAIRERLGIIERKFQGEEIPSAKIGNLDAGKITTGTLTLGGSGVGAPTLRLLDSLDSQTALLDENGLRIDDGNIEIYDENGALVFDSKGIVSVNGFGVDDFSGAATNQVINTTSWVDITGTDLTLILDRPAVVRSDMMSNCYLVESVGNTCHMEIALTINGVHVMTCKRHSGSNQMDSISAFDRRVLLAGTHTFKIQARLSMQTGTGSGTIFDAYIGYETFGK